MKRNIVIPVSVLTVVLGACGTGVIGTAEDELVFEGEAVVDLLHSTPQQSTAPFARTGLRWDSPSESALEIQFSDDGETWSAWQPVTVTFAEHIAGEVIPSELNEEAIEKDVWIYAGHADAPSAEATHFRVRAATGEDLSFASIELMADVPEPEVTPEEYAAMADPAYTGQSSQALTYGSAYVHPRSAWGARASRCSVNTNPYRMTIHHTAGPNNDSLSPQARMRQIQSYHMDSRGWCDIGYHFVVSHDDRLWQARALPKRGAHVANGNTGNIGVSFMGNYVSRTASETQLNRTAALLAGLADRYDIAINRSTIKGHRERSSTTCPGDALFGQLGTLVNRAASGGQTTVVIDSNNARNNTDVGYIEVSSAWTGSASTPGYYGTGYWWISTAPVSDPAIFHFYLPAAASRIVDAWWTAGANRSTRAPFMMFDASGQRLATVRRNQQANGGKWNQIGSYNFTKGWNSVQLSRWAPEGKVVIADAVRIR